MSDNYQAYRKAPFLEKKRWNREYFYLAYRESGNVKFDYVCPVDSDAAKDISDKIAQRKELESKLRQVDKDIADVERGLRGKR